MHAAVIRKAQLADVAAIQNLEVHFPSDRMSAASVRRLLRVPSARVWVAEMGTEIVGSLVLLTRRNTRSARIYSVVVSPKARGQGLAQQLVGVAETYASKRKSLIFLEVRQDNTAARALYRKLGYAEVKALPGFYEDGFDGLRLSKPLKTV